ncbi:hypothetical protein [Lonepinella koalarum]|uniref:hypothetical protein n=1 Tax=Lonepinella koalarum TaxID=53417 RepID=UPI0037039E21
MSIQTEFEAEIPTHKGGEIGIDMGIARFATLSNGVFFRSAQCVQNLQRQISEATKTAQKTKLNSVKIGRN